jgi:Eukaryotic-type carbonic anhydrase
VTTLGFLLSAERFSLAADTFSSLLLGSTPTDGFSAMLLGSLASNRPETAVLPHVHYMGSLTTPPCSQDVNWCAVDDPVQLHVHTSTCVQLQSALHSLLPLLLLAITVLFAW